MPNTPPSPCLLFVLPSLLYPNPLLYLPFSFNLKAHSFIGLSFLMILDLDICQ
jgi:hypothetical protein